MYVCKSHDDSRSFFFFFVHFDFVGKTWGEEQQLVPGFLRTSTNRLLRPFNLYDGSYEDDDDNSFNPAAVVISQRT